MIPDTLRRARANAALTLRALAARSGIAASNLSVIESGRRDATATTIERIARTLGVELIAVDTGNRVTAARAADAIAHAETPATAYRAFLQLAADLVSAPPFDRVVLAAERPAPTGSRWDDAIAGVVEWALLTDGAPLPPWTRDRQGDPDDPWEPQRTDSAVALRADIRRAPEPLRRRGVAIEADELVAA